jgi:hypothetical protein
MEPARLTTTRVASLGHHLPTLVESASVEFRSSGGLAAPPFLPEGQAREKDIEASSAIYSQRLRRL